MSIFTVRETRLDSNDEHVTRPALVPGEKVWDGITRAARMRELLGKSQPKRKSLNVRLANLRRVIEVFTALQLIVWTGTPPKMTPAEAAAILAASPGLSNRTHVRAAVTDDRRRPIHVTLPMPVVQGVTPRESEVSRAIRMGIPGGWTPLEWAILHGGGKR